MMADQRRIHFVEGNLQDELDRLGVNRTDHCVVCDSEPPDDRVGSLSRRSDNQYDTVCVDCEGVEIGTEVESR